MEFRQEKLIAFALSAVVFPGAGQIYLGQRKLGALIISLTGFVVIYPLFKFAKDFKFALERSLDQTSILESIFNALEVTWNKDKHTILIFLCALIALWLVGVLGVFIRDASSRCS